MTARTLEEPTLMPLTLEEIEKRLATADRIKTDGISWRSVDLLLAIAQGQRAEIARLQDNASTAAFDKIADQLREANRENEEQRAREALIVEAAVAEIRQQRRFALEESECGGPEINDSLDMTERRFRDAIAGIGTKR